jgi:dihydroorotate dehydrogenase
VNNGKRRDTAKEEAAEDYVTALDHVNAHADYVVLNVSSPNTPHLRELQDVGSLTDILRKVTDHCRKRAEKSGEPQKLVFTKVAPECSDAQLEEIARLSIELRTGLMATNTTVDWSVLGNEPGIKPQAGGLSGRPLREKSNAVIRKLRQYTRGVVPIIGVGGVFSAEDAYEKIRLGASLVQVYSGWIYRGPDLVPDINRGLLRLLERDGFSNIEQAVGTLVN